MTGEVLPSILQQTDKEEKIHTCILVTAIRDSYLCCVTSLLCRDRRERWHSMRNQNHDTHTDLTACCRRRKEQVPVFGQIPTWSVVRVYRQNTFNNTQSTRKLGQLWVIFMMVYTVSQDRWHFFVNIKRESSYCHEAVMGLKIKKSTWICHSFLVGENRIINEQFLPWRESQGT